MSDELPLCPLGSPPKKKRKKNNQCNLLLFKDFSYRCHLQNNISPTIYRAAKYNIKNLCPLHDMLPVIIEMENDPFKHSNESHFNGVRYTLRNGYLQNNVSDESKSIQNIMNPPHADLNNINTLSLWVCTGTKNECIQFKHKLLHKKKRENVHKSDSVLSENGVVEIPLNVNNVLHPFMSSLANGSQNTNLYFNVTVNQNENKQLSLRFLPLDSLTIQNQINTKRLSFKVLSCGTFKRNLQPMPDACRITKMLDTQCCYACIDDEHNIGLKITTNKVFDRKKSQGSDSILGAGFDCSSRCSWRKPRIYWVNKTIGYIKDPLNCSNKLQKKVITNQDVRISLFWPKHMTGSVEFYLGGIMSPYEETIHLSNYKMIINEENNNRNDAIPNMPMIPSPNLTPNPPSVQNNNINETKKDILTAERCVSEPQPQPRAILQPPQPSGGLYINSMSNMHQNTLIYPMPNMSQLFATPPIATNTQNICNINNENNYIMGNDTNTNNTNGIALGSSASSVDAESFAILTNIEKDLITGSLSHSTNIHKLNVEAPYVLDALSQLLVFCIKHETQRNCNQNYNVNIVDVHCYYYVAILNHIAHSLSYQCAVDGFIKCWIDIETEDTTATVTSTTNNHNNKDKLCSFMHLVTRYNRIKLMQHTINLFTEHHKDLFNAFVDIRTTLYNESSLIIAIKIGYQQMIEYMFNGIWSANGIHSPIIMNNIITSPFNDCGVTILSAFISFKLFSVLRFLLNLNCNSPNKFLSQHNIMIMEQTLKRNGAIYSM